MLVDNLAPESGVPVEVADKVLGLFRLLKEFFFRGDLGVLPMATVHPLLFLLLLLLQSFHATPAQRLKVILLHVLQFGNLCIHLKGVKRGEKLEYFVLGDTSHNILCLILVVLAQYQHLHHRCLSVTLNTHHFFSPVPQL